MSVKAEAIIQISLNRFSLMSEVFEWVVIRVKHSPLLAK